MSTDMHALCVQVAAKGAMKDVGLTALVATQARTWAIFFSWH